LWSKEKKFLEDKLAESLIGKIEYNLEGGRKTTWGATYKVEIRYNKKSLVKFGEGINYLTHHYENVERQKLEKKTWTKEENYIMFLEAQKRLWIEEKYTTDIFFKGMVEYLSLSIEDALKHDEWMIRLFAIMDKRLGKRSLLKLEKEINNYPKMLQIIYKIRMKEEGFKDYQDFNI
jgi:hypothetical protein